MTQLPPRVTTNLGQEYLLVSSYDIEPWSYTRARENLLTVLSEGLGSHEVRELAERFGYAGDPWNHEEIASCVAREIASGRLVVVALPPPCRGMRPMFGRNDASDGWETAVPLSSLSKPPVEPPVSTASSWLEVQFVDPWWRPFAGMMLELELPNGDVVRRAVDGEARLRIDALQGPRRPCKAWIPTDAAVPNGPTAGAHGSTGETGRVRRGGAPIELPLETHNVIIVEVPHVPSW